MEINDIVLIGLENEKNNRSATQSQPDEEQINRLKGVARGEGSVMPLAEQNYPATHHSYKGEKEPNDADRGQARNERELIGKCPQARKSDRHEDQIAGMRSGMAGASNTGGRRKPTQDDAEGTSS